MKTILGELEQKNKKLYESYLHTYDVAVKEWLPLVTSNLSSFNSLPHLLGVISRVETLLFSKQYCEIELTDMELYILISSCLLHDLGKASIFKDGKKKKSDPGDKEKGLAYISPIAKKTCYHHNAKLKCGLCSKCAFNAWVLNTDAYEPDKTETGSEIRLPENIKRACAGIEHGQISSMVISESWHNLGLYSQKAADIISVVCCFHSCPKNIDCFIHNDYYIEDFGRIRARLLAALLVMGDHLDDSFKRASPEYFSSFREIEQIGKFRNKVQYTRIDKNNRMICSVLNRRYIQFDDMFGTLPQDYDDPKRSKKEADRIADRNEGVYSDDKINILYQYLKMHILNGVDTGAIPRAEERSRYSVITSLMDHAKESYKELTPISNELHVLGIPIKNWFIECDGHLFGMEYNAEGKFEACKYFIEPALDIDFCNKVFFAMYNMSSSVFGKTAFSYYDIINFLSEYPSSLDRVTVAVKRIERMLRFYNELYHSDKSSAQYEVYAGEKVWKLSRNDASENGNARNYISAVFEAINQSETQRKEKANERRADENPSPKAEETGNKLYVHIGSEDYKVEYENKQSIILDSYLDILLNGETSLESAQTRERNSWNRSSKMNQYEMLKHKGLSPKEKTSAPANVKHGSFLGGLIIPNKEDKVRGSGNVVIIGEPGLGKSTLAFQIAVSCTSEKNNGIAVYYSLGTPREQLVFGMLKNSEAGEIANRSNYFPPKEDEQRPTTEIEKAENSDKERYTELWNRLKKDESGSVMPQILFPMLSPNGITDEEADGKSIFRKRFHEIEEMLRAIRQYNDRAENTVKIKIVIIDSLNDLSNDPLNKTEVRKLFNLFEDNGILGIFTVGENKYHTREEMINVDAIKYDADTVIQLRKVQYRNYTCNLFSVNKSRYISSILGEHPYKIKTPYALNNTDRTFSAMKKYIEVIPSVHYIITGTSSNPFLKNEGRKMFAEGKDDDKTKDTVFGIDNLLSVLPDKYSDRHRKGTAKIVNISGDSGCFKSDIAMNAALYSLLQDESCLVIRMSERNYFEDNGFRIESTLFDACKEKGYSVGNTICFNDRTNTEIGIPINLNKRDLFCWEMEQQSGSQKQNKTYMYEAIYKSGALMPEEFINDIIFFIINCNIKTVILTDIKYIGVSFPFLVDSPTSGDLFLSAFVHIMQNQQINLITTSSTVGFDTSANELKKIQILSDAVIECTREKTEKEIVHVTGEGSKISGKTCRINVDAPDLPEITMAFKEGQTDKGEISLKSFRIEADDTTPADRDIG